MIDPNSVSTLRVGQLPPSDFSLTDKIPHEVGTDLNQGTVQQLSDFIALQIETSSGIAFRAVTVVDGGTLPNTTVEEWILVGKGTFYNVNGGATIVCTEELNALMSNGIYWFIGVEIPIVADSAYIILVPKIQFTADGVLDTFNIGVTATIKAVFWNGALLNDSDWSQTGTTFSLTFTPALGDLIKPI